MITDSPTLCLCMIVKNESKIIERLLHSVSGIIDTYCICDTGSTDDTVEKIRNYFDLKNINGIISSEPFKNFEYNRNYALKQCLKLKADYILLLDADMILDIRNFDKSMLKKYDCFTILQGSDTYYHYNMRIVKNVDDINLKYCGVTHEYLSTPSYFRTCEIKKNELFIVDIGDGGSKADKFERDIRLLTEGIKNEPDNVRYHFYLANSYRDSGKYEDAIKFYKKRIKMGGWQQEVWYSYYRIGLCYLSLNQPEKGIYWFLLGFDYFPERIENMYEVVKYYRYLGKNTLAFNYCKLAIDSIKNLDNHTRDGYLFLVLDSYIWALDYEYIITAYYNNIKNIDSNIINVLNNCPKQDLVNLTLSNIKFYDLKLVPNKIIDHSHKIKVNINDSENQEFNSSTPCIIKYKDGYLMNIRLVNYKIKPDGSYEWIKNIITLNKKIIMDKDFNVQSVNIIDQKFCDRLYIGVEDIRLYNYNNFVPSSNDDTIIYIATGYHKNDKLGIVTNKYRDELDPIELYIPDTFPRTDCEKNWVFIKDRIIYKWFPLTICKLNKNFLEKTNEIKMPNIFKHVRGSTCASYFNNQYWLVAHIVSYEKPRHYYHILIILDDNYELVKYSRLFKFEGEPIEYCLGLIVEKDRVIMTYSTWDRTSKLAIYDFDYINSLMKN